MCFIVLKVTLKCTWMEICKCWDVFANAYSSLHLWYVQKWKVLLLGIEKSISIIRQVWVFCEPVCTFMYLSQYTTLVPLCAEVNYVGFYEISFIFTKFHFSVLIYWDFVFHFCLLKFCIVFCWLTFHAAFTIREWEQHSVPPLGFTSAFDHKCLAGFSTPSLFLYVDRICKTA